MTVIAVDGPAASGKGTVASRLARWFQLPHMDTGLLYRAVGVRARADLSDAAEVARAFDLDWLQDAALRSDAAAQAASKVGAIPAVRAALLDVQRAFAERPRGAVLDGRDIGTVIVPSAPAKLFIDATVDVRAARRHADLIGRGLPSRFEAVLADLGERDARDRARATAPLTPAKDALVLDTSRLDIDQVFAIARAFVLAKLGQAEQDLPLAGPAAIPR
jgi:cytidylate kinase